APVCRRHPSCGRQRSHASPPTGSTAAWVDSIGQRRATWRKNYEGSWGERNTSLNPGYEARSVGWAKSSDETCPPYGSIRMQQRDELVLLRGVDGEIFREARGVGEIVRRLEGVFDHALRGVALDDVDARRLEFLGHGRRHPGRAQQPAVAQRRDVKTLFLEGRNVGQRRIARLGKNAGHRQA